VVAAIREHFINRSELFRPQQRREQINEQQDRNDTDKYVFHGSKPPAGVGVSNTDHKKADGHENEQNVLHKNSPDLSIANIVNTINRNRVTSGTKSGRRHVS